MVETTKLSTNKRAVIYARVSTKDQDCQRQLADCRRFAEAAGYLVGLEVFETASGARNDRKERSKLMALARKRLIDAVLITELSRWGRSTTDLIHTVEDLYSYGVTLQPCNGEMSFDPSTATGKLLLSILAVLSEFERSLIQERIRSGLAAAKAKGKKLGRRPGSGTTIKQNSSRVRQLRASGLSIREIASSLRIGSQTVQAIVKSQASTTIDDLL